MKEENYKEYQRQFPYLSKKEIAAIDPGKQETLDFARDINTKRKGEVEATVARQFVSLASKTRQELGARQNQTDLDQFETCMRAVNDSDPLAALDLFLYNRPDYRAELNSAIKDPQMHIKYDVTASRAGERAYNQYIHAELSHNPSKRALLTTADDPGAANTIDTTVAQSIMHRAENLGNVMPLIAKVTLPYGDYEEPFYNKYAAAGYLTETGTVPDFNTELSDATDGIQKNNWSPRDFALGLEQSLRSLTKLSPSILNDIFKFLAEGLERGMEKQAINGSGAGTNDPGMILNATSVPFAGNAYLTFIDARAQLGKARVKRANLIGFANSEGIAEFEKLGVINEAYEKKIVSESNGVTVAGTTIIEVDSEVIPTTAGVTTVVLGDPNHYLVTTIGTLKEYVDDRPQQLQRFTAFHVLRDGQPRFDDSFAKFTLNV